MDNLDQFFTLDHHARWLVLHVYGDWTINNAALLEQKLADALSRLPQAPVVDASGLTALDTAGAWVLCRTLRKKGAEREPLIEGLSEAHGMIWSRVVAASPPCGTRNPPAVPVFEMILERLGKATYSATCEAREFLIFLGEATVSLYRSLKNPGRLRVASIVRHMDEAGIDAIPIITLIAFLISIVLAYQGAAQLRQFGAEIFTVNLVAISVFREMGVLLTAIMIAGRSGSAFTAEIGVMKVNEEVDAMRTMGLDPFEVLVIPRLVALIIVMPLLTFLADVAGLTGAGVICYFQLDIPLVQYIQRVRDSIELSTFMVGMVKAPVFGILIGVVGCLRGMQVSGSAESVGRLTTVSVVESIFLVILADALFSILFTKMGI